MTAAPGPPGPGPVLISTSTYPLRPEDGLPRFVADLASAMARETEVIVLAPSAPGVATRERVGDVDVVRFPYFRPRRLERLAYGDGMPQNLRSSLLARLQVPLYLWRQTRALRRVIRESGIRHVNAHWLVPQGLTAAWVRGRDRRFFHLLSVHAADVYLLQRLPFGSAIARYVVSRSDAIFADGTHVAAALDALLGRPSGAVVQPMGVDTRTFQKGKALVTPPPTAFADGFLCFVGRFVEKKGTSYLLQALPKVRERYPGLGLVLIGYGPLETELRSEVEGLDLEGAVLFAGRLPHQDIVAYLHHCRAAVVPSIIDSHGETEGMPTVVLEAMAAGCRVVGSAVDGIPDVLRHGENGWLCREKDADDLAEKLLAAIDLVQSGTSEDEARETALHHDWREVGRRYLEALRRFEAGAESRS